MSMTEASSDESGIASVKNVDLKLEVVVIPVSDVDRAKEFYGGLGWRLDADFPFDNGFRVVQFTPPGSGCSVQFGTKMTSAVPGSAQGHYLIVSDIQAARDQLAARNVDVSEVFYPGAPGAQFQTDGMSDRVNGTAPDHASYSSFATFSDPDGNTWLLQEVTTLCPGGSMPPRRHSLQPSTWRAHFGAPRLPTVDTKCASAWPTRTGRIGTRRTWLPSRPGRSFRRERLRRHRHRWRLAGRALCRSTGSRWLAHRISRA